MLASYAATPSSVWQPSVRVGAMKATTWVESKYLQGLCASWLHSKCPVHIRFCTSYNHEKHDQGDTERLVLSENSILCDPAMQRNNTSKPIPMTLSSSVELVYRFQPTTTCHCNLQVLRKQLNQHGQSPNLHTLCNCVEPADKQIPSTDYSQLGRCGIYG